MVVIMISKIMKEQKFQKFNIMSWYEKEKMMAIADPHGLSGDSYPDGTPMTNFERWEKLNERSGQH